MKLSKTAKVLLDTANIPRVSARNIGMFLGTDLPYQPGGLFVRYEDWVKPSFTSVFSRTRRYVGLRHKGEGHGWMRWYAGRTFAVYKVLRVTPQTLIVKRVRTVDVYFDCYNTEKIDHIGPNTELAGVLFECETVGSSPSEERLYIRMSDAHAMIEYKNLDLTKAQKVKNGTQILHDHETETLVAKSDV